MIKKECRLTRASKYAMGGGGGGGGGGIQQRIPSKEKKTLGNWENFQINREGQFVTEDPLLGPAQTQALDYNQNRLPQLLGQFPEFGKQLQGNQNMLSSWLGGAGGPNDIISSGGALTGQLGRDASQQYRDISSASGNLRSPGAAGAELLNRDAARQTRYNTALAQGQGLVGMQSALTGQQAGLTGQEQAVQTGGLNQLLGVGNAGVSQFTGLTNPIMGYLSGLFSGNQQASIAGAQIAAQQQAAGDAKTAGGISAGGSVLAAAIPAIIGL